MTIELCQMADILETHVAVKRTDRHLFKVSLFNVVYKEKNTPLRKKLEGTGFTIDDAAYDFFRLASGGLAEHCITNKTIEVA